MLDKLNILLNPKIMSAIAICTALIALQILRNKNIIKNENTILLSYLALGLITGLLLRYL